MPEATEESSGPAMKLGLLGDIHGNSAALRAVLGGAAREKIDALCITGDYVGYYYRPGEVLELLSGWQTYSVRGNHEDMLARARTDPARLAESEVRYGSGLRCAMQQLDERQIDWLVDLPVSLRLTLGGRSVQLAHGTPWDTDEYVYPDAPAELFDRLAAAATDLVVLGHTHYQMQRIVNGCLIVNPGSVGQPRDRRPGAAWASFDTETGVCQGFAEAYDVGAVQAEALARDPQLPYLREVLTRQ
jgi:putative phosphoesterase